MPTYSCIVVQESVAKESLVDILELETSASPGLSFIFVSLIICLRSIFNPTL